MNLMGLFRSPQNELEKGGKQPKNPQEESHEITMTCPKCGTQTPVSELWDTQNVCRCGHHFRMTARQRISFLADEDSFTELDGDMTSRDILNFPNYENKLKSARFSTREKEGVLCGTLRVEGEPCAVFCMDPHFMMGSMGTVVGEKITRLFEYAAAHRLPVVGFTAAGGARMQEGILSLMQMAKTSGAVRLHSDAGLFYLTVLTDPTTGGVTASFAMDGDVIMAEPDAMVGFAGARVIEQTIRKKLPEGFQRAEFLLEHGFVDLIAPRNRQRAVIAQLLRMHDAGKQGVCTSESEEETEGESCWQRRMKRFRARAARAVRRGFRLSRIFLRISSSCTATAALPTTRRSSAASRSSAAAPSRSSRSKRAAIRVIRSTATSAPRTRRATARRCA